MRRQERESVGRQISRRQRTQRQVRALLHEQAGPQWGFLVFLWLFCVVTMLLLQRLFSSWPWYVVLVWATLLVAVESWRQHRRVRRVRHVREADPVLVAITGYGQEEDRRSAVAAGFDHHFVKPIDLKQLQETLNGNL